MATATKNKYVGTRIRFRWRSSSSFSTISRNRKRSSQRTPPSPAVRSCRTTAMTAQPNVRRSSRLATSTRQPTAASAAVRKALEATRRKSSPRARRKQLPRRPSQRKASAKWFVAQRPSRSPLRKPRAIRSRSNRPQVIERPGIRWAFLFDQNYAILRL